jgi:hypothetical protein
MHVYYQAPLVLVSALPTYGATAPTDCDAVCGGAVLLSSLAKVTELDLAGVPALGDRIQELVTPGRQRCTVFISWEWPNYDGAIEWQAVGWL